MYAVMPNLGDSLLLSVEDYERLRDSYEATLMGKSINKLKPLTGVNERRGRGIKQWWYRENFRITRSDYG